MRSLFNRLFFSFLFILILSTVLSSILLSTFRTMALENIRQNLHRQFEQKIARMILVTGKAAYEVYLHNSLEQYNTYLEDIRRNSESNLFTIYPDSLKTVSGRPVPDDLQNLVQACQQSKSLEIRRFRKTLFMADHYLDASRNSEVIIAAIHTMPPPPGMPRPIGGVIHFFSPLDLRDIIKSCILIFASGLVCFFLARSLTSPLRKLRRATQKIAAGDLTARTKSTKLREVKELQELSLDFDIMAEKVEKLVNNQKRLLRDISHELRSPLARLNIALELLKNDTGSKERNLARIEQESNNLNSLIGQLLDVAKSEAADAQIEKHNIDLISLLQNLVKDAMFELEQYKEICFNYAPDTHGEITVYGNYELIRSALENILRNSIKYTADFSQVKIDLFVEQETMVCIQIEDSGPGIPEEKLQEVTQPFYRVEDSRTRKTGGTGIGLTIAHQAIKINKGKLYIFNNKEKDGLIVQIFLPIALPTDS